MNKDKSTSVKDKTLRYRYKVGKTDLSNRKKPAFSLCPGFYLYLVSLVFCLIFSQSLKSPVSHMLLVFLLAFPPVTLLYVLLAPRVIKIHITTSSPTVEKLTPLEYKISIHNESPLPFPFVDVYCLIPAQNTVRCVEEKKTIPLNPFSRYAIRNTVRFRYRGLYQIGVTQLLVCDFFKLFCFRIDLQKTGKLCVFPRKLYIEGSSLSTPSEQSQSPRLTFTGTEQAEMREIRPYKLGDSPKTIHWKLSFKTEELQVRHFIPNPEQKTLIFCDLSAFYPPVRITPADELAAPEYADDLNEFCADALSEMATAVVLKELRNSTHCRLVWPDSRSPGGCYDVLVTNSEELDAVFPRFATAPLGSSAVGAAGLIGGLLDNTVASVVIVTANLSAELLTGLPALFAPGSASEIPAEVRFFNPASRYKDQEARRLSVDSGKKYLVEHGLTVIEWEGDFAA